VPAKDLAEARATKAIVRCWGPRGTLHLIAAEDLSWLYPLVRPSPAGSVRRLRQLSADVSPDDGAALAAAVLAGRGPLTKSQLGGRLAEAGLAVSGQAIVHLAVLAAGQGRVVLGPDQGGKATYVHAADWLGAPVPVETADREAAMRTLVVRYRAAHDPCTAADLAAWSGLPKKEIDRAWAAAGPALAKDVAGQMPAVRLIPAYDEYLLGWRDRDHAVPGAFRRLVHPGGGVIRSAVLADGLVVGTWQIRRTPARAEVTVEPFASLPDDVRPGLTAEVADIGVFLGLDARLTLPR
jgi:DNA glycosylase AlkZ-like